jgi:hypothetical protein
VTPQPAVIAHPVASDAVVAFLTIVGVLGSAAEAGAAAADLAQDEQQVNERWIDVARWVLMPRPGGRAGLQMDGQVPDPLPPGQALSR